MDINAIAASGGVALVLVVAAIVALFRSLSTGALVSGRHFDRAMEGWEEQRAVTEKLTETIRAYAVSVDTLIAELRRDRG